jgi:hypothetical protein
MRQDAAEGQAVLQAVVAELKKIKERGDKAMAQLAQDSQFHWTPDKESNSIDMVVRHLHGNMMSRWTDFLTTDGEKSSRNRDAEFEPAPHVTREKLLAAWEQGWTRLFDTVSTLTPPDLLRTVTVRGTPSTVLQTLVSQCSHYATHVGQIIYVAKHLAGETWQTLSIPRRR